MSEQTGCPPNFPRLSPYLVVRDAEKALDFYARAFGFAKRDAVTGPEGRITHAEMSYGEAVIMFAPESASRGAKSPATAGLEQSPVAVCVYCPDVDALFARATAAGARALKAPEDQFWGDRLCQVLDPDGHSWCFLTHKGPCAAKA
jgi:uncharacterized glyoxalase superfamily protein PhnB